MKRNGTCPFCYIKKFFMRKESVTNIFPEKYQNGVALTPPMGWSSWNTFKNRIDEDLIYDTALAMKQKGLSDAGYTYINLDDCWHSNLRDENGDLQGDLTTFPHGIECLVKRINNLGLKTGIYSSNGTLTCEDLPASLGRERADALTFARWGIEYFKYDFCHNVPYPGYAPLVYGISIAPKGEKDGEIILCERAKLSGLARFMIDKNIKGGKYVSGLDENLGSMVFDSIVAPEDGEYVVTVHVRKKGQYEKLLMAIVNDSQTILIPVPSQKHWNYTARFQFKATLKAGINTIKLFNPIRNRADSAMLQYRLMGDMLISGAKRVAEEKGEAVKPIVFSICEWGKNRPYYWGASAGNLWRTTPDIRPIWKWMTIIYEHNVKLYKYAGVGAYNDPDMLEVGNGKLSYDENVSHFSLWCMMNSPLILGNDLRTMPDNVKDIVTNKALISINQDKLCKQAKRIKKGKVDILAKPLEGGSAAVCFFNKGSGVADVKFDIKTLIAESYVSLKQSASYHITELWTNEKFESTSIRAKVASHGVKVYKIDI